MTRETFSHQKGKTTQPSKKPPYTTISMIELEILKSKTALTIQALENLYKQLNLLTSKF